MNRAKWALAVSLLVVGGPAWGQEEAGPVELKDVEYARVGARPLKLDLSVPARADKPVPLVVWIHGGGWRAGSKDRNPGAVLLRAGYAVASVEYRLSREATFPAQIHDCKAAIRFLRANAAEYGFDGERIGVWGSSAGGHLATLLGTSGDVKELEGTLGNAGVSSRVQAVVDLCGPADLETIVNQAGQPGLDGDARNAVALLLGGPVAEKRELARLGSPTTHVSKDDPPFLILHGDADRTVPVEQSRALAARLKGSGVDAKLIELPGVGHNVLQGVQREPRVARELVQFFQRHLRDERPAAKE